MKKMLLTAIVCLVSALASGSDGTGVLGERVCKDIKPFSALNISNCCNVVYEQGDEYKVRVVAEKALLDSIADIADCKVVGGMLVVSVKNVNAGFLSSLERVDFKHGEVFVNGVPYVRVRKEVTVYVTAPNINRFLCQGSGSLRVDKMDADKVEFFVSGAGSVDIKQLNANDATFHVSCSGSGLVDVRCTGTLLCNVSGAGSIEFSGTAAKFDKIVSGGGSVCCSKLRCSGKKVTDKNKACSEGERLVFGDVECPGL
ncbi:GIN domain-containing protein [Leyella stercorea]|uniref:GIN domain-containing protein n=1 Tax=Leyella stercorea TaxID=363265 RepID=UPI0024317004|nr:DUF2807 domain-containing protein [Leyella stercorea]